MSTQQLFDAIQESQITWAILGAVMMYSFLTVIRQDWTDALTRQDRFGIVMGLGAVAVFIFMVLPYATWGLVLGIGLTIGLFVGGYFWYRHFSRNRRRR